MAVMYSVAEAESQQLVLPQRIPAWADVRYDRKPNSWLQQDVKFVVRCADGVIGVRTIGDPGYRPLDPSKPFVERNAPPCIKETREEVLRDWIAQLSKQLAIIELEKP